MPSQKWKEAFEAGSLTQGLETAAEDPSSWHWIDNPSPQWSDRDYVTAVHLRTVNLPTVALLLNLVDRRMYRGGCYNPKSCVAAVPDHPLAPHPPAR